MEHVMRGIVSKAKPLDLVLLAACKPRYEFNHSMAPVSLYSNVLVPNVDIPTTTTRELFHSSRRIAC